MREYKELLEGGAERGGLEGKTINVTHTDLLILLWVHIVWLQELNKIHIMLLERECVWEGGERTEGWREKAVEKLSHTHMRCTKIYHSYCATGIERGWSEFCVGKERVVEGKERE